jgi:hypothetical protein
MGTIGGIPALWDVGYPKQLKRLEAATVGIFNRVVPLSALSPVVEPVNPQRVEACTTQTRRLMHVRGAWRPLIDATRSQLGEEVGRDLLTPKLSAHLGPASSGQAAYWQAPAQKLVGDYARLNAPDLVALTQALTRDSRLVELVASAALDQKTRPLLLLRYAREVKQRHQAAQSAPNQFGASIDVFGVTFTIGLETYVYGKVKGNDSAKNLGKTLVCLGLIPQMLLTGIAFAALMKVFFGVTF